MGLIGDILFPQSCVPVGWSRGVGSRGDWVHPPFWWRWWPKGRGNQLLVRWCWDYRR